MTRPSLTHPYAGLAETSFWSRAVAPIAPGQLDPMVEAPFSISPTTKVATLGSCFAQHISRHLAASGFNYFVTETAPEGLGEAEAKALQYGTFSARYGNIYTVRQAVQLFDRAFGKFTPDEDVWTRGEVYVDPFRPLVEPQGYPTPEAVREAAKTHLEQVRAVFTEAEVIVFTLGLTEAWLSRDDGAVFAAAPGVAGGEYDPERHQRANFNSRQVSDDLEAFCTRVRSVNPEAQILLTVSPVPLIATHDPDQHVLAATTYSKSVLRVAAGEVAASNEGVTYFPSYEIITSSHSRGAYFEPDLRSVREAGVAHVMRIFARHFLLPTEEMSKPPFASSLIDTHPDVVCDENIIQAAMDLAGFSSKSKV